MADTPKYEKTVLGASPRREASLFDLAPVKAGASFLAVADHRGAD
jgi:hypothetical protein